MSLWYESLSQDLYNLHDDPNAKARCILAYLTMDVPRFWWKDALETGHVRNSIATLLHDIQLQLSQSMDLTEPLSAGLLVALAFIDKEPPQTRVRFDDPRSHRKPEEYIAMAKMVLAKRPELARVGRMIETAASQQKPS